MSQSTSCCSLQRNNLPMVRKHAPSSEPVGRKRLARATPPMVLSRASRLPSWFCPQHPRVIGRRTHEFPQVLQATPHVVGLIPSSTLQDGCCPPSSRDTPVHRDHLPCCSMSYRRGVQVRHQRLSFVAHRSGKTTALRTRHCETEKF